MGLRRSGDAYRPGWLIARTHAVQVQGVDVLVGLNISKFSGV